MNFTVTEHHMKSYIEVAWTHIYPVHERNFETGFIATPFRNFLQSCTNVILFQRTRPRELLVGVESVLGGDPRGDGGVPQRHRAATCMLEADL